MPRKRFRDILMTWSGLIFVFVLIFTSLFTPMAILHSTFSGSLDKTPLEHYYGPSDRNSIKGTRASNPYTSPAIYPNKAENSDGDNLDHLNVDEEVPGDNFYEKSGDSNEPDADWIEVTFPCAGIPTSSIINNITFYYGYYTNSGWGLTTDPLSNITFRVDSNENNLGNYTLSSPADTDIDAIRVITGNLPGAVNLNSGNFTVRFRGVDGGAPPADNFYLDYCYFTINYSIPNIVINEVMFNPTGSDNNSEWIELFNAESYEVNLTGWSLTDNDGNIFDLSGAGSIPAGGYLVCHLAQSGANSSTDVHGAIIKNITLQPNDTEGMDNFLTDMNINSNYGDSSILDMENGLNDRRTIIQFNISSLPNGITDSHIWLYKYDGPSDNDLVANVHRVISPWTESGSDWNTYDGSSDWPINDDGGDYAPSIENTTTILREINGWYSWDITDLTKAWKNGTYQNYGMIFIADVNSKLHRFRSSDYTTNTSMRPKLIVYYRDITINKILEDDDDLALLNNDGYIIDYLAWGSDPGFDDDNAVYAGQWNDGDYVNISQLFEGQTLGRDMSSNDTDQPEDWQNSTGVADPHGVDRSDMYGPSPGEANTGVSGFPVITGVSSNPPIQYTGGYVNITCIVIELEGVDSVWANITLPGGGHINTSMEQGFGNQWYHNNTYITLGIYKYTIWANNTNNNWSSSSVFGFTISISKPTLSDSIVTPVSGYVDSWFNFTVSYSHPFNKGPDIITLNLTGPSGGELGLIEVDSSDADYTDGKLYYHNRSGLTMGSYSFHFAANDTDGKWSETGEIFLPSVVNRVPSLSASQVSPGIGYIDTGFNFTVTYTDLDNHIPNTITVNITGLGIYKLTEADTLDVDYTDGKSYYINTSGIPLGTTYTFHFAANDTIGDWIEMSEMDGPDVINRDPILSLGQVQPTTGYNDTWFNFTVTYSDLDGHATDKITVNITNFGILDMIELDPSDINYTDGKFYYFNVSGLQNSTSYFFHFAANDTIGDWTETAELPGPQVLNSLPTLLFPGVTPLSGSGSTYFNFTLTYMDMDNHPPQSIIVNLTGPSGGVFDLVEVDISDMDSTDGKLYYYNVSGLTVGSYSFHFSANDSIGGWAVETPEIDAPVVQQISATLTVLDETVEYSDVAYLNASLFENGTPISGEDVAFYIDVNDNGIYEPGELAGSGATLADGTVSVICTIRLAPDIYDYTAIYIGSGGFDVEDSFALFTINPKPATLTAQSRIVEEDEVISLNATLTDSDGNPVAGEIVDIYVDKNKNSIYEGGELMGSDITSASGTALLGYTVNLAPGDYDVWARYVGSGNYSVTEIEGLLVVQNTTNTPPTILGIVPDQIKPEDSQPWTLDLTSYEADIDDSGADLKWYMTGIDTTLYSVTGHNSTDDVFTFIPVENAFGNDEVTLWLVDSSGDSTSQIIWVNITPVNDLPYFNPIPPNIFVHYDDPDSSDDDPEPWDYTFYVHDIETPLDSLVIVTSEPSVDAGEGYAEVDGLVVTYRYPHSRLGESILVTLTLYDGSNSTQTVIMVNITSEWVPELVINLPDITIEENTTTYSVFDLDDYFTDKDQDSLFFSSGYFHLSVVINENNTVDITPLEQWTGSELVTFRATDPTGAIVEDTITVTVEPVNDGPVISGAPDLVVHYDYSYGFDFSPYIHDPDNAASELSIYSSESTNNIWVQQYNNLGIVVNYPESMNGMTFPVTIYVSDGIETTSQEIQITISDDFPPELLYKIPDVSFDEDTVLEDYLLLSYYFLDPDGDAMYFTNGTKFINAVIDNNLAVGFSAPPNWYGHEYITFRATDPSGALAEDKILVVVVPVNDAPTISNLPRQEKDEGDQWVLDLSPYIDDVDNDLSQLEITMESEVGHGYVVLVGKILVFQYPKSIESDIVTITVSDGELETTRSFTVTLQSSAPVAPSIWDVIPWLWVFLVSIAAMSGAFAFYSWKRRYNVYEAFLIHEKGLPIAHASYEESSELEDVVVSGMFTAVQDFIGDAFSGKTQDDDWKLDEMKFGENKILIERSENLYLAAIFEGSGERLGSRIRKVLKDIDAKYSVTLTDWDGDMTELAGISAVIAALVSKKAHKQAESEESQTEIPPEVDYEEPEYPHLEELDVVGKDGKELDNFQEGSKGPPSEEAVMYECPECESEIKSEDIRCPACGVEFSRTRENRLGQDGIGPWTD